MRIAIIGYGEQGRSAYEYWNREGNQITICELKADAALPSGVQAVTGPDHLKNLDQYDLIVRSPIVHPKGLVAANGSAILRKVTTVTNEFLRISPSRNIIGVTGSKGKGTTSTLLAKMLEAAGQTVHLGGNIGIAPLDMLKNGIKPEDWVVLELANFQIIDMAYSPRIAVCLMLTEEHLDWHTDMADYVESKANIFTHQKADDIAIYFANNTYSKGLAQRSAGHKIPYYQDPGAYVRDDGMIVVNDTEICPKTEVKLLGEHNLQNVCAALTAFWQVQQNVEAARSVLTSFAGLEHRLELVRELNGVKYYNDSFATTPESTEVALQAFAQPKVAILGGSEKGLKFDKLADAVVNSNVKQAIVIGDTADKIVNLLKDRGYSNVITGLSTMPEIVQMAREHSSSGDVVLLSPGCASFGLFKNYKDRGEKFKLAVQALV